MASVIAISQLLTGSTVDIYTVPAGKLALIEHLWINSTTAGTVTLKRYQASNTTAYNMLPAVDISAKGIKEAFQIRLKAGDIIQASAATTTDAVIHLFGIEDA
jgi:hypothetical protein